MEVGYLFAPKRDNHFPNQATNIETIRIAITRGKLENTLSRILN